MTLIPATPDSVSIADPLAAYRASLVRDEQTFNLADVFELSGANDSDRMAVFDGAVAAIRDARHCPESVPRTSVIRQRNLHPGGR